MAMANATEAVNYLNSRGNKYEKAYVSGSNNEYVILPQFYSAGQSLVLPAFEADGITAYTISASIKFRNVDMQPIKYSQSGNA
jgi:hypothetical protein